MDKIKLIHRYLNEVLQLLEDGSALGKEITCLKSAAYCPTRLSLVIADIGEV